MVLKYNLNWQTFTDHLLLMFKDLYEEEKYSDVTLVCDDQTQFKAHKIVLSACSPVFKILNPHHTGHEQSSFSISCIYYNIKEERETSDKSV